MPIIVHKDNLTVIAARQACGGGLILLDFKLTGTPSNRVA
jgi:hypothetical protein